jgi:hypothetical protein
VGKKREEERRERQCKLQKEIRQRLLDVGKLEVEAIDKRVKLVR